jgi:hypothetical protein
MPLLLRIVFFILEATVTSYGLLAIREVVAMLFASMMLIKTDVESLQMSCSVILPVVALVSQMAGSLLNQSILWQVGFPPMVGLALKPALSTPLTIIIYKGSSRTRADAK